ncbi:retron St85 family effector protein [Photobacterium kishitanii]|uniref:retron St85 family effector protein n=1 Tax=Photobacterium kishitanii TaxID=318456 RepID=UPI000B3234AB|nr:retron St85 family effector protein [Photobacterium kishitanii]
MDIMNSFDTISDLFLENIDTKNLRIKNFPNYIFFCGGEIENDGENNNYISLRNVILKRLSQENKALHDNIILAEKFKDWLEDANIDNLIDFEILLAGLASSVILIVEGPGAFAELGAFSVLPQIYPKLITIYNCNFFPKDTKTFIEWGPIKYLENKDSILLAYNWDVDVEILDKSIIKQTLTENKNNDVLIKLITRRIQIEVEKKETKTAKFIETEHSCLFLLIADLIYIYSAITFKSLHEKINKIESISISKSKTKEYIYSLKKLGIIKESNVGATFYLPTDKNNGYIKYSFKERKHNHSASSIKSDFFEQYIEHNEDIIHAMGMIL